jgi:hypothetical protein
VERILPGWDWNVGRSHSRGGPYVGMIWAPKYGPDFEEEASSAALALIAVALVAVAAQE